MVCKYLNDHNTLCSAYFRFKTKIGIFAKIVGHMSRFFRSKKSLFLYTFFVRPLCSYFYINMS